MTGDTSPPPSLHVTDVWLDDHSDSDDVRLTGDLMCGNCDTIVSVRLWFVDHPLHGVIHFLPQCPNLTALCITPMRNTEVRAQMVAVILRLTQLDTVRYYGRGRAALTDDVFVAAVLRLTQLRCIRLVEVSLDDDVLVLTADWTRLHTVVLRRVRMSVRSWGRFVSSLLTVPHPVNVTLRNTDIEYADTVGRIQTSPHFTVTRRYDRHYFTFTTVPHTGTRYDGRRGDSGRSQKK